MKNLILACLALGVCSTLNAETYQLSLVPQEDTQYLLDRIKKLEEKAKIWSNQWDVESEENEKKKYLVFEEMYDDGKIHQSGKIEAFKTGSKTTDRISITFENDKIIQNCETSKECTDHPASLVTFRTQSMMTSAKIFRVKEVRYENNETKEDGLLCTITTEKGTTHRLRLITED